MDNSLMRPKTGATNFSQSMSLSRTKTGKQENEVPSDPFSALAVKHGRAVQDCVELYLANRGITKIQGFERFVNIETLWLNGNRLTKVNNLDENFRLKRLYLHDNSIHTLKGSLEFFTFLDTLSLYNNQLHDLQSNLEVLSSLRHLEELDMHGNPLSEETNYRLLVIKNLPWLNVLDRHKITDEERERAAKVKTASEMLDMTDKMNSTSSVVKRKPTAEQLRARSQLSIAMSNIAEVVKTKRLLLKEHFMEEDPRREWVVLEKIFVKYMVLYGLDVVAKHVEGDFDAFELILRKYSSRLPPVRSKTMGRDVSLHGSRLVATR